MFRCKLLRRVLGVAAFAALGSVTAVLAEGEIPVAQVVINPAFVSWQPHVVYAGLTLRVAVPDGRVLGSEFLPGQPVGFDVVDEQGQRLPDGQYTYELIVAPQLAPGVQQALRQSRAAGTDEAVVAQLQQQNVLPREPLTQSGYFSILGGSIVVPTTEE
ncbi:MAG: hypothetical protein AB7G75_31855 [Candidatus Binatia bacterium]